MRRGRKDQDRLLNPCTRTIPASVPAIARAEGDDCAGEAVPFSGVILSAGTGGVTGAVILVPDAGTFAAMTESVCRELSGTGPEPFSGITEMIVPNRVFSAVLVTVTGYCPGCISTWNP